VIDIEPSPEPGSQELLVEMGRLNGLSDGVFAIALTLLVLDIRIPEEVLVGDLSTGLLALAPKALVYLISFVVIGGAWGAHQRMLGQIKRGDGILVWFNLFSLLFVTLVPASAALLGRFPKALFAITVFAADVILIQLTALWLWRHASRHGLTNSALDERVVAAIGRRLKLSAIIFGLSIPLALVNTTLAYLLWIGTFVLLFTTDWLSWQKAIRAQRATIPLDDARRARIYLQYRGGQLNIDANVVTHDLIKGVFGGGLDYKVSRSEDVLDVRLNMLIKQGFMSLRFPWAWGPADVLDWNLSLAQRIPIALEIENSSGQARLELGKLQINELKITTSASSMLIGLPANGGQTVVNIEAAMTSLVIQAPEGVGAYIQIQNAIANAEIDVDRFEVVTQGHEYRSRDYDTAANRVDMQLEVAFGSVKII
jgi:uncharacterized membrane protein